jgi:hypothetical protein
MERRKKAKKNKSQVSLVPAEIRAHLNTSRKRLVPTAPLALYHNSGQDKSEWDRTQEDRSMSEDIIQLFAQKTSKTTETSVWIAGMWSVFESDASSIKSGLLTTMHPS